MAAKNQFGVDPLFIYAFGLARFASREALCHLDRLLVKECRVGRRNGQRFRPEPVSAIRDTPHDTEDNKWHAEQKESM
jgi:hypothetical protein